MEKIEFKDVDAYIALQPENVRVMLEQFRQTIKEAAPDAEEVISYQMPAYKYKGILVYFAAYKNHIGFYPTGSSIVAFKDAISAYKSSKGAIQFRLDTPLPLGLISDIVKFRVSENEAKKKK